MRRPKIRRRRNRPSLLTSMDSQFRISRPAPSPARPNPSHANPMESKTSHARSRQPQRKIVARQSIKFHPHARLGRHGTPSSNNASIHQLMALLNETAAAINPATIPRVNATLNLEFAYDQIKQTTILQESSSNPPLKVVRAFQIADSAALVHLHNVSGGLLGDDRLAMSVRLGQNAKVQITTTGATRIYRARESATPATQQTEITLAEKAFLEYLP